PRATDRPDDARHRVLVAGAVERDAGVVEVDAVERRREAVRVALTPHLAVGDHVDAGALHVLHREPRRVVLRLLEPLLVDPPQLTGANARRQAVAEALAVDQPVRLRVAPDDGRDDHARSTRVDLYSLRSRLPHGTRSTSVWTTSASRSRSRIAAASASSCSAPRASSTRTGSGGS